MNSVSSSTAPSVQEPPGGTGNPQSQVFGREVSSSVSSNIAVKGPEFLSLDTLPASIRNRIAGTHCASPHLYDYVHRISLNADQSAKLVDGGGQCIISMASGQWALSKSLDPQKYTLHITNPEDDRKRQGYSPTYRSFNVDFIIDTGEWTNVVQSPGKRRPDSPIPTLTCFSRLIFDHDPLKLLYEDDQSRPVSLYDLLEKDGEFLARERVFYAMSDAAEGSRLPPPLADQ